MVATTARWTAIGLVAVGVTSIAAIHACPWGDRAHRPEPSSTGMADPPRPAAVGPSAAQSASRAPAPPGEPPATPTVSLPCVDDRTELRIGQGEMRPVPVLCWGDHCIDGAHGAVPTPPALVTAAGPPAAVVGLEQVCTGARCDPLGRRLRAAVAKAGPDDPRSATRDHAAIVIWRDRTVEIWNRASDRRIDLNTSPIVDGNAEPDTTPESIDVLGDFLLVSWDCHEWCSSVATLLDGRGRDTGTGVVDIRRAPERGVSRLGTSIFAAGDDRFLVFGQFGEISMIAHGRVIARSSLVSPSAGAIEFDARAVPDGEGNLAALWCRDPACYVTRISVLQQPGYDASLELEEHAVLPRCSGPDDHKWPPRPYGP